MRLNVKAFALTSALIWGLGLFGANPISCTKRDRVLDRINTPRGEECNDI